MALEQLLATGAAGFIGSNFAHYWHRHYPQSRLIILDALTYAGNRGSITDLLAHPQVDLVEDDICDRALVTRLLKEYAIDTVVHFAAESHVDRSILGPEAFVQTNIVGIDVRQHTAGQAPAQLRRRPKHSRLAICR